MTGERVSSWINKRQPKPTWPDWLLQHVVGSPDLNGSFLIRTKTGREQVQARVHVGAMVFERKGVAYTCAAGDARRVVAELADAEQVFPRGDAPKVAPAPAAAAPSKSPTVGKRFAPPKGMPPSIENRHPSELRIDDSYQRSIDTGPSRALIKRIAETWDWRMCMPLVVSKRDDGSLYVLDGQHRLAAAQLRGDIPFLPCCVAVYAGVGDEAAMFVAMNRSRRSMNRLDDFHAAQAGGDSDVIAVAAMIERVGFTVSRRTGAATWAPGEVAFTSAIAKARRRYGDATAEGALKLMAEVFVGQRLVVGASVFTATASIMGEKPAGFSVEQLRRALATFDMPGWASFISQSKGGSDRAKHLRDMLMAAYADAAVEQPS